MGMPKNWPFYQMMTNFKAVDLGIPFYSDKLCFWSRIEIDRNWICTTIDPWFASSSVLHHATILAWLVVAHSKKNISTWLRTKYVSNVLVFDLGSVPWPSVVSHTTNKESTNHQNQYDNDYDSRRCFLFMSLTPSLYVYILIYIYIYYRYYISICIIYIYIYIIYICIIYIYMYYIYIYVLYIYMYYIYIYMYIIYICILFIYVLYIYVLYICIIYIYVFYIYNDHNHHHSHESLLSSENPSESSMTSNKCEAWSLLVTIITVIMDPFFLCLHFVPSHVYSSSELFAWWFWILQTMHSNLGNTWDDKTKPADEDVSNGWLPSAARSNLLRHQFLLVIFHGTLW